MRSEAPPLWARALARRFFDRYRGAFRDVAPHHIDYLARVLVAASGRTVTMRRMRTAQVTASV